MHTDGEAAASGAVNETHHLAALLVAEWCEIVGARMTIIHMCMFICVTYICLST